MSNLEKAEARLRASPPQADFRDVRRVLEGHGWRQARQNGSHISFTKPGAPTVVVPIHNSQVKRAYVDRICAILGLKEG